MRANSPASGYAEALLVLAKSRNELSQVESGLRIVGQLLRQSGDFRAVLREKRQSPGERMERIKPLLGAGIPSLVASHILLMMQHGQENLLGEMIEQYLARVAASQQTVSAEVFTVVPLDEKRTERMERALSAHIGQPVKVHNILNESLVGGVFVKLGNDIIDHSVRTRLKNLRSAMTAAVTSLGMERIEQTTD